MSSEAPRTMAATLTAWTVNAVLVAVTVVAAGYLVPSLFGYERYVITGGSMSGTFEKGSIAFEKPVDVSELAVGDVVTYLPPPDSGVGTLVTHRIVKAKPGEAGARVFVTQGDANADPDPWKFTLDQGSQPVVRFTVPYAGYALIALADRETRMLVIGVPAGLIALLALLELVGAVRKRDEDDDALALPVPSAIVRADARPVTPIAVPAPRRAAIESPAAAIESPAAAIESPAAAIESPAAA